MQQIAAARERPSGGGRSTSSCPSARRPHHKFAQNSPVRHSYAVISCSFTHIERFQSHGGVSARYTQVSKSIEIAISLLKSTFCPTGPPNARRPAIPLPGRVLQYLPYDIKTIQSPSAMCVGRATMRTGGTAVWSPCGLTGTIHAVSLASCVLPHANYVQQVPLTTSTHGE